MSKPKLFAMHTKLIKFLKTFNVDSIQKQFFVVKLPGRNTILSTDWANRIRHYFLKDLLAENENRQQLSEGQGGHEAREKKGDAEGKSSVLGIKKKRKLSASRAEWHTSGEKLKREYKRVAELNPHVRQTPRWKRKSHRSKELQETAGQTSFAKSPPWLPLSPGCQGPYHMPPPSVHPRETQEFLAQVRPPWAKFHPSPTDKDTSRKTVERAYHTLKQTDEGSEAQKHTQHSVPPDPVSKHKNDKVYPGEMKHSKNSKHQAEAEVATKMKALIFEPDSLQLNLSFIDAPGHLYKDEVLIQVVYSGVSNTDLLIKEGKLNCDTEKPLILGHEFSGKVYAVGNGVSHVRSGDDVVINPYTACNVCRYCNKGLYSLCLNEGIHNLLGMAKDGGWAEYVVVKKSQVYKVPPKIGLDQAVLIEPLSCVLSAMTKLKLANNVEILIQGLGLTGCLWACVLHSKGYRNVLVSDKSIRKLQRLKSLNLGYDFLPPEEIKRTNADVIIECSGVPTSIETCLAILNPNGKICLFKKPSPRGKIRFSPYEIVRKEITIVGDTGNSFGFSEAIDLAKAMGHRYLDFDKLGVGVFELQDFRRAFHMQKTGDVGKIMFTLEN